MIKEKVFEILAEGGSICIERIVQKNETKFIYNHNEFDPTDEGLDVSQHNTFDSFETPFQLINKCYPWHALHLSCVHDDFKYYVAQELVLQLNKKLVNPEEINHSTSALEDCLQIQLSFGLLPVATPLREITIEFFDGSTCEYEYDNFSGFYYSDSVRSDDLKLYKKTVNRDTRSFKCRGSLAFEGSSVIVKDEQEQPIYVFNSRSALVTTSAILGDKKGWHFMKRLG